MNRLHPNPAEVLARISSDRRPRPELDTAFVAPADGLERAIADCWSEVLHLKTVGTQDNFFSLGGDSIHMTLIASRVRERCGVELPVGQFFSDPTVGGFAKFVHTAAAQERQAEERPVTEPPAAGIAIVERPAVRPATHLPPPTPGGEPVIGAIAIATSGRPAALERCLSGLVRNLRRHDRSPRLLVIDGSPDPKTIAANHAAVDRVMRAQSYPIALADNTATRAFAQRMVAAGFDEDLIEFALPGSDAFRLGSRLGASRNLHLLATAGDIILSIDDDTDCRFTTAPEFQPKLAGVAGIDALGDDPAQVWVHPSRSAILSSLPFSDIDLLGSHEALLGRSVSDLRGPGRSGGSSALDRVRVTLGGLAGDCAWGTPSRYLFLDDTSFARLTRSDDSYRASTTSREMLRVAPASLVSGRVEHLIAAIFGADGRTLLPPFVPVGRGSDVVFGRLLKAFDPAAAFGHVPWAILHEPVENRRFSPGEILRSGGSTDIRAMFCSLLTDPAADWNAKPGEPLATAGRRLVEIGTQTVPDFQQLLFQRRRLQIGTEIAFLEHRLAGLPPDAASCRRDITSYLQALSRSSEDVPAGIPAELLYGRELPLATHLGRKIVTLYGHLLCAWQDLINETRRDGGPFRDA